MDRFKENLALGWISIILLAIVGYFINLFHVIYMVLHVSHISDLTVRSWFEIAGVIPAVGMIGSVMGWLHLFM